LLSAYCISGEVCQPEIRYATVLIQAQSRVEPNHGYEMAGARVQKWDNWAAVGAAARIARRMLNPDYLWIQKNEA
jgi:hypothetical protein